MLTHLCSGDQNRNGDLKVRPHFDNADSGSFESTKSDFALIWPWLILYHMNYSLYTKCVSDTDRLSRD